VTRTRQARSGELRISYQVRRASRLRQTRLVLIQGVGLDGTGWGPALPALQSQFRLVLVDNRGTGHSDAPAGSFGVADMASDVIAVLDDAGIDRAHVLGASLGGMVAQELAMAYPERVDRLVLACTTPGWPLAYPLPARTARLMAASPALPRDVALRRHAENALSGQTAADRPDLLEELVEHLRSRPVTAQAWLAQTRAGARYVGGLRERHISAPTLVLQGSADTVVEPRNAELLARRIPGAQTVIFPGLGHLFFWEDPAGFAAAVTAFLRAPAGERPQPR
jgi:3-oxoadipate enol-lactonase